LTSKTIKSVIFILNTSKQKGELFFWLFVRFVSATLPLVTIYQFSHLIKLIENKTDFHSLFVYLVSILAVRLLDNFLRLRSTTQIDYLISNLSFDIHNFFLVDFKPETKEDRHASIQAIRNFADATIKALTSFKQPGVDSIVSVLFIPVALFFVDFRSFILIISYITIYSFVNYYTSQRYKELRDYQNTKTEDYYAKLQESNDIDLEQSTYTRHFHRLTNWTFIEWFFLQNTAVVFYFIFLFFQVSQVFSGTIHVSDLILIIGYVTQTQAFLNSFTDIVYGLDDMSVALGHLARNKFISVLSLDDLT
jgi:ABC-type multidrug transport system fused ATPase/permease subunit